MLFLLTSREPNPFHPHDWAVGLQAFQGHHAENILLSYQECYHPEIKIKQSFWSRVERMPAYINREIGLGTPW